MGHLEKSNTLAHFGDRVTMLLERRDTVLKCRAPDMPQELSRLWRRLRSLQDQPELGAGVADCQVVENSA